MAKIPAFLKRILKLLPVAFTKNQRYDAQSKKVIKKVCSDQSNCIDVGCHKGEVLDIMMACAPNGNHIGFEPIPDLYNNLLIKYKGIKNIEISNIALADETKETSFNYVVSNPSYSGLKKRDYDHSDEKDKSIKVQCDLLDNVVDKRKVDLMKIDVEGGEYGVLQGSRSTIIKNRPVIIFEHGLGASEFYGTTPEMLYRLLQSFGMKVSLMNRWLSGKASFTEEEFKIQFYQRKNYYFIAYFT